MTYIRGLPINDTPEIFGLHDNANITYAQNETFSMMKSFLLLQPKSSGGSRFSREEVGHVCDSRDACKGTCIYYQVLVNLDCRGDCQEHHE